MQIRKMDEVDWREEGRGKDSLFTRNRGLVTELRRRKRLPAVLAIFAQIMD